LKILNLCFHDFGGGAYTLSHAINKHTKHHAINLRSTSDYLQFPTLASMKNHTVSGCRRIIEKADVVIYHTAVLPYFKGFALQPKVMAKKKNILFFHGSEMRSAGTDIMKEADEVLGDYTLMVSTPDLLLTAPRPAHWIPTARSFSEIKRAFGYCNQDRRALRSFGVPRERVVFTHAPTHEATKGSPVIYKVITQMIKMLPHVSFVTIRHQPWANVLRTLSEVDVLFDSNTPEDLPGGYGNISVEASVFKVPSISRLSNKLIGVIKQETGLKSPFITFNGEDDLTGKVWRLADDAKLRRIFGEMCHDYCKAVHDEKPVVDKFMRVVEEMN